jgi:hypothetical protein
MSASGKPATITPIVFGQTSPTHSGVKEKAPQSLDPAVREEISRYIAQMSGEMAVMARSAKLDVLAYFLEMAKIEANTIGRAATRA